MLQTLKDEREVPRDYPMHINVPYSNTRVSTEDPVLLEMQELKEQNGIPYERLEDAVASDHEIEDASVIPKECPVRIDIQCSNNLMWFSLDLTTNKHLIRS